VDIKQPLRAAFLVFIILAGGLLSWMVTVPLSAAVIASGYVVVRGKPQLVQHLDGGIVKAIEVRNGDEVRKGDVVVRLDEATLKANLDIYLNRLREAITKRARLEAERDGLESIAFDLGAFDLGDVTVHMQRQESIFRARMASRAGEVEKLKEKIGQYDNQTDGLEGLIGAKTEQLNTIKIELDSLNELLEKGIATKTRVYNQERMKSDLTGQLVEHIAELARISNAVRETEVSIIQIDRAFKEKVLSELSETATQAEDLTQQISATRKQLERIEIRAPASGIVHELSVNTVGGTVSPNGTLMQIIATDEGVDVEVSIDPNTIDQVALGQGAALRFPAFNQSTTPEIMSAVERISPSSVTDERTGLSFYRVILSVTPEELGRLQGVRLIPGMPVEAYIRTGERTMASFLMKPLIDHLNRAMRE
jgi:HlyD family secretion protein